jgi:RNA polymerase sigma-70 factor (ECF subfamily)
MSENEFGKQLTVLEKGLYNYARSLKLSTDDAKDLVQETFLKAFLNREKYSDKGYLKAWTISIMRNTFINNYRRNTLINQKVDQTDDSFFINQTNSVAQENPDSAYSIKEMNSNIELLNKKFRIPFKMYVEGYKYKEISESIKVNIGTVKSRIFFARKELKEQLAQ